MPIMARMSRKKSRALLALEKWMRVNDLHSAAMARQAGISRQLMSLILSGRNRPGLGTAIAIERATCGAVKMKDWIKK